jgi:NodT family efflux transporter outer membrane factor (OMF) lipoprotein
MELPPAFSATGEREPTPQWWRIFGDPRLDALVDMGLSQSFTLEQAWQRLEQARATARSAGAARFPSVDASGGLGYDFAPDPRDGLGASLGFSASYEVDLWGRVRSARDAAAFDVLAREEDMRAAAISLSGEIATTWYDLAESYGQLALLAQQQETNEAILSVVEMRFRLGRSDAQDILRQRQQIEANRAERIRLEATRESQENRLAVLLGQPPMGFALASVLALPPDEGPTLAQVLPIPETGVPAELLQDRPDLRAAFRRLQGADQRVAVAVADRYPRLSLSGSVSTSTDLGDIFTDWIGNLGANLFGPLFDGGRRAAEVDRTEAVAAEAFAAYGQTVLTALGEVEDALNQTAHQARLIESLAAQEALAAEAVERARDAYQRGGADFITVLDALRSHQTLERNLLSARRAQLQAHINLCRALGGRWDVARPERFAGAEREETRQVSSVPPTSSTPNP